KALEAMLLEMQAENISLYNPDTGLAMSVTAGFRGSNVYDEHITGLSVDMHSCTVSDIAFKNTVAYGWLSENCWKFGFIVRYPEGKSAVTGVSFRPWQFRYVGRFHARTIYTNGLTLEEYLKGTE
ncbi:MAG: M15 family metallopeptidase, partial [Clostridia bacterium]|nr:M15 family metallopeptidase [Clostridia bacterium]